MPNSLPPPGYRMAIIPPHIQRKILANGWTSQLAVSDVGYFPHAHGHQRERTQGCSQLIIMVCVAGKGWCKIAGTSHAVPAGTVVMLPAKCPHAYGADPDDPWTIWWIHIAGSQIPIMQRDVPWLAAGVRTMNDTKPLIRLISRCLAELEHGHDQHRLHTTTAVAWQLIGVLAEAHSAPAANHPIDGIALAIQHMHAGIARPLTVEGLAHIAGWSPSHFAARFKAATGLGPIDYLLRLRMERAAWLLDNSNESISAIAEQLGYTDSFYFSRRFRTHHGCAPSVYRMGQKH